MSFVIFMLFLAGNPVKCL